ncbi:MAG: hypothetical protein JO036_04205 [Candidatus Eremiobacteraeota bacterium]|nr:hypothetical protein [Candidatus Eremiobacteraeota bacterium]
MQENRSFDNLFHGYPGADTVDYGITHDGTHVRLQPVSLAARYDISNNVTDFVKSYHGGTMDGFDLRLIGPRPGAEVPLAAAQYPQYGFVPAAEVAPYFQIAHDFVLADRMFQSNIDQSFVAHLYLIAGQANRTADFPSGRPWGCDAGPGARVATLKDDRTLGARIFPCFDIPTLADELDEKRLSWAYYAPKVLNAKAWRAQLLHSRDQFLEPSRLDVGQLWSSFDVIPHERYGPSWQTNIISPSSRFFKDVAAGQLRSVSWVVPDYRNSDHAGSRSVTGPLWVASIINAIGRSRYWSHTVILITWDDSGGWYDHVAPPQLDYDGLGLRVPLLVVSPYSKRNFISHKQYEFGSLLRFTESVFGLRALAPSDSRANDLDDCFDFSAAQRTFEPIQTPIGAEDFLKQRPSSVPPDD